MHPLPKAQIAVIGSAYPGFDRGALDFALNSMIELGEVVSERKYDKTKRKAYRYLRIAETP